MAEISQLPPLILHPFGGSESAEELLDGSRASQSLQRSSDPDEADSQLMHRMMMGRYHEVRMLLFLGKDIFRWMRQCVESVARSGKSDSRITEQSFAGLIVDDPPSGIQDKLNRWGVTDRRAVFSRALGINSLFSAPPPFESLSPGFLANYHRYADHAYICYLHLNRYEALDPKQFEFALYASEEYAKMLSDQWELANP